jgi:hypothetical protein
MRDNEHPVSRRADVELHAIGTGFARRQERVDRVLRGGVVIPSMGHDDDAS